MRLLVTALMYCGFGLVTLASSAQSFKESELRDGDAKLLTSEEIRSLHADRTVFLHNVVSGQRVPIWFGADGIRAFRAGNRVFTGEWGARENKRCEETVVGPVVCMTIYRRGDELLICDPREAPDCRWRITRSAEGDIEKLAPKR